MMRNPSPESTHRSMRSLASKDRPGKMRSFSFSSHQSEPPASPAPTHHSLTSRSSRARSSIYSENSEKAPFLPTFTMTMDENGEQKLKFHGEQIWEPSQSSGGQRTETKHQRGCVSRALEVDQANWKTIFQDIIGYKFRDVDLLEEALESEGSGMTAVGKSQRHFLDGNKGLAKVGEAAMTLVLRDQCYLFRVHEDDAQKTIKKMIEDYNELYQLGLTTKIQQYIRHRAPLRLSQKWSVTANIKDDFQGLGKDAPRVVAIGIKAVIGAVYFDGGYESARRVMAHLGHIVKLPEAKPAPVPNSGYTIKFA